MTQELFIDKYRDELYSISAFSALTVDRRKAILDVLDFKIFSYERHEVIAEQGNPCKYLMILLEGCIRADMIDGLGNLIKIEDIIAPRSFATPHLFSKDNTLPSTFTVVQKSILLFATKESTLKMISMEQQLLKSFFHASSNCNKCTVARLRVICRKTVRERFIVYLLNCRHKDTVDIFLTHSESELAGYLNVTRPALSKEINKLIQEG